MAYRSYQQDNPIKEIVMTMHTGEVYTLPIDRVEAVRIEQIVDPWRDHNFTVPTEVYVEIRLRVEAGRWSREYRPLPDGDDKALPMRAALPGPTE